MLVTKCDRRTQYTWAKLGTQVTQDTQAKWVTRTFGRREFHLLKTSCSAIFCSKRLFFFRIFCAIFPCLLRLPASARLSSSLLQLGVLFRFTTTFFSCLFQEWIVIKKFKKNRGFGTNLIWQIGYFLAIFLYSAVQYSYNRLLKNIQPCPLDHRYSRADCEENNQSGNREVA